MLPVLQKISTVVRIPSGLSTSLRFFHVSVEDPSTRNTFLQSRTQAQSAIVEACRKSLGLGRLDRPVPGLVSGSSKMSLALVIPRVDQTATTWP